MPTRVKLAGWTKISPVLGSTDLRTQHAAATEQEKGHGSKAAQRANITLWLPLRMLKPTGFQVGNHLFDNLLVAHHEGVGDR